MAKRPTETALESDPLWYKDAVIYEVHVRTFFDSNADGIGDFRGLREKLDYLQDLGVTALWLLPFYPSPLRDDGYDIADYTQVHESYGTLRDFRAFLDEAHNRGLRVITELVVNHTSDEHRWFQRARKAAPGSRFRDYYVWSDAPDRYPEARVIFKDFEASNWTWDRAANAYYWHRFYSHQPDLNFDNPEVHESIFRVMDHWMEMGVDGMRLDAIPYLYEREGTNCENLPETHEFLKQMRSRLDRAFPDRLFLAEANQWPEDAVAYFGEGDECHVAFHFPLMPRLFMAIHMEDRFPIFDILEQTPEIPEACQWAIFLRNHDELTLEMVTDEERDYMYRVYAQDKQARLNLGIRRRLAPLLGNNRRKIELMKALLLSLPGTPVLYYGDEIGMGDNIYLGDRNGVRTPMQWSADRNAGFSRANPQQLYLPIIIDPEYHYETVNVEAQQNNPHSLLWWTKRLIGLRKNYKAFSRGSLDFLHPENRKVLAFIRQFGDEQLLLVFNLSRFTQFVELDLSAYNGMVPVELFGQNKFPPIGELPYFVTLGPHSFYWFELEQQRVDGEPVELAAVEEAIPEMSVSGGWESLFKGRARTKLEALIPRFLPMQRWYGGKARQLRSATISDSVTIPSGDARVILSTIDVEYTEGDPETYVLPLGFATDERMVELTRHTPHAVLAYVNADGGERRGVIFDAVRSGEFAKSLLGGVAKRRKWRNSRVEVQASLVKGGSRVREVIQAEAEPWVLRGEQSNTSIGFDNRLLLKIFRRLDPGVNPDLEIGRFLTRRGFAHVPAVLGAIEWKVGRREPATLGIVFDFVASEGDAWGYTLDVLGRFYEGVLTRPPEDGLTPPDVPEAGTLELSQREPDPLARELFDPYLDTAALLGRRTAELHRALASEDEDPAFAPERLTRLRQRSVYQSMRSAARQTFQLLRKQAGTLSDDAQALAREVIDQEAAVLDHYRAISRRKIDATLIRVHGDYHLGQVLFTGKDFVIIDFEGEPAKPIGQRRLKRSPLRDVAGMLRSFHYATYAALLAEGAAGGIRVEDQASLEPWAGFWNAWVSAAYLKGYLEVAQQEAFLPTDEEDLRVLLRAFILEKAVYELSYELNNRPDWLRVPLQGVLQVLRAGTAG